MRDRMRVQFLEYNQDEMIGRFSLESDESFIYIRFFGRDYRISRETAVVEWSKDGFETYATAGYNESMSIYDVLCCSKSGCRLKGEFMPESSLKGTVYTGSMTAGTLKLFDCAEFFDLHADELECACRELGGIPEGRGDIAFRLQVFDFLPARFALWRKDEDFSAEINFLWDENVLDFLHYETLWFIKGHMLSRLKDMIQEMN